MKAAELFDLPESLRVFAAYFPAEAAPWAWVKEIGRALAAQAFEGTLPPRPPGVQVDGLVYLHPTVKLPAHATIIGPTWIGAGTEIRPGAFIRGNVIVGERCVLGNACEFKNCLLLDRVQVPHFSYVGDSVLGNGAHLGAGVICSNLRLDQQNVTVDLPEGRVDSGRRKLGALIGDGAEVGCNAVLNPGTILGRRALVMPLTSFSGTLPAATLVRNRPALQMLARRD
ncbi:UDP-N-acetylglucosamine diphosphorylase [Horticoccus luteus]|uniref:UDP-N-acetylglucosamine diphosphorylase n=1 Tax=Horticoccus luteus TaxID=2862869 RepID=A0A8F9XJ19_9BACT|nr:UDP-N-acetylglucosamine diphosphorylase [Horticoccus luteus]QYM78188.1 UDP-N-acetylglucosamine diphosphorylase [Horticoccus luteus]